MTRRSRDILIDVIFSSSRFPLANRLDLLIRPKIFRSFTDVTHKFAHHVSLPPIETLPSKPHLIIKSYIRLNRPFQTPDTICKSSLNCCWDRILLLFRMSKVIKTLGSICRDNLDAIYSALCFFSRASIHKFSAATIYDHYTLKLQINWINTLI